MCHSSCCLFPCYTSLSLDNGNRPASFLPCFTVAFTPRSRSPAQCGQCCRGMFCSLHNLYCFVWLFYVMEMFLFPLRFVRYFWVKQTQICGCGGPCQSQQTHSPPSYFWNSDFSRVISGGLSDPGHGSEKSPTVPCG